MRLSSHSSADILHTWIEIITSQPDLKKVLDPQLA